MKPIPINLVEKKDTWKKISLGLAVVVVVVTCAFTFVNVYDYMANTKTIQAYETRLQEIKQRKHKKKNNAKHQRAIASAAREVEKNRQTLTYFQAVIKKNMFPVLEILSLIEQNKPEKVNINGLSFSDNLKTIVINGESENAIEISRFFTQMARSRYFESQVTREEITEEKKILFELKVKWVPKADENTV